MPLKVQRFSNECTLTRTVSLEYLLFLPANYTVDDDRLWPLILFLHGAGERGSDLEKIRKHGIPKIIDDKPDFPFVAISPQCPADDWWTMDFIVECLVGLLNTVQSNYRIDQARIYLTGLSMGGYGTWALAERLPDRFAALAPICGAGHPERIAAIAHIPTWIFHGEKDQVVQPEESDRMYHALKEAGSEVKYTLYPEAAHDSWTQTYKNPELFDWFLKNSNKKGI